MRNRLTLLATLALLATPALAEDAPKQKTKGIDKPFAITTPFSKVSISGSYDVDIIASPITGVVARGDLPGLDLVSAVVEGDTLKVSQAAPPVGEKIKGIKAKLTIQVASLAGIDNSGTGKVLARNLSGGDLDVRQSGTGELALTGINYGNIKASVSEDRRLFLDGKCGKLDADATSGGQIDAASLKCSEVKLDSARKADVSVRATDKITLRAEGNGSIKVKSKPSSVDATIRGRVDVDWEN